MSTGSDKAASAASPVRKFAPVPVETSIRSSKKPPQNSQGGGSSKENKSDLTQSDRSGGKGNDGTSQSRRYLPEPVEVSSKSSRRKLPQPVETSTSRRGTKGVSSEASGEPKRKYLPQPVETTRQRRGGRGGRGTQKWDDDVEEEEEDEEMTDVPTRQSSTSSTSSIRKFAPELVETVRGSYRQKIPGQDSPETPRSPNNAEFRNKSPESSPRTPKATVPLIHESRYSAANLARQQEKRHSFVVPDLPSIPSNSSEESAHSSGSTSPSAISADVAAKTKKASEDDQLPGYLLEIAARVVERQLRDQALAAFPNEPSYQPVDHYALEEDADEEEVPGHFSPQNGTNIRQFRRDSAEDLDYELSKMREHHDELEKAEDEIRERALANGESRFSASSLAARKGMSIQNEKRQQEQSSKTIGQWQKGVGLAQMRNAASPPMLGGDIKFPFSVSPKMTRCDVDQAPVPRRHEDEQKEDVEMEDQQLWSARINVDSDSSPGLWMGTCATRTTPNTPTVAEGIRRSGLMTPAAEKDDPFNALPVAKDNLLGMHQLPLTPLTSRTDGSMDNINRILQTEEGIGDEFDDAFVTQIYNYLSLGYPSLAHPFDHELSKISRIPVEELRKDDSRTDAKGYVGAPEGNGVGEREVLEGKCARWTALRLYIREWARQQPLMSEKAAPIDWGARVRRGSWAI